MGQRSASRLQAASLLTLLGAAWVLDAGEGAVVATPAVVLLAGDARIHDGVVGLVSWLVAGATVGGLLGYGVVSVGDVALPVGLGVGLGVAFGGGLGVVSNLLAIDEEVAREDDRVAIDVGGDEPASPTPADLFDGHPDPVLFVVDEGHGPVVRAANDAYVETFDVTADVVTGAPVADAVMSPEGTEEVAAALADGRPLDVVVECETDDGEHRFRLRVAGDADARYLVYTPVEW